MHNKISVNDRYHDFDVISFDYAKKLWKSALIKLVLMIDIMILMYFHLIMLRNCGKKIK